MTIPALHFKNPYLQQVGVRWQPTEPALSESEPPLGHRFAEVDVGGESVFVRCSVQRRKTVRDGIQVQLPIVQVDLKAKRSFKGTPPTSTHSIDDAMEALNSYSNSDVATEFQSMCRFNIEVKRIAVGSILRPVLQFPSDEDLPALLIRGTFAVGQEPSATLTFEFESVSDGAHFVVTVDGLGRGVVSFDTVNSEIVRLTQIFEKYVLATDHVVVNSETSEEGASDE